MSLCLGNKREKRKRRLTLPCSLRAMNMIVPVSSPTRLSATCVIRDENVEFLVLMIDKLYVSCMLGPVSWSLMMTKLLRTREQVGLTYHYHSQQSQL